MKVINLHEEEQELIRLAIGRNRHAQQKLYQKHAPKMLGVCRQYVRDMHQAEDVMITAFMKVFTNLASFEAKGSFEGWIRRIMVNECLSFLRASKRIGFLEDTPYKEPGFNDIESGLSVDDIQSLIDGLADGHRTIFNLYCIEGYKHKEIAGMLGISEGTSKSQLSVARAKLQEQLAKHKNYSNGTE